MHIQQSFKLSILSAIFVSALLLSNIIGVKIISIFGVNMSVSIFIFPLTFLILDAITEVYGKQKSQEILYSSLSALLISMAAIALAVYMQPAGRFTNNAEFITIFQSSLRIMFASVIAFLISQTNDIFSFSVIKEKTHGRFLWLRNNVSTIISQFLDTTLFMFIAFYQMTPRFDVAYIFALIIPWWLVKIAFSFFDTPFIYLIVAWLRKGKKTV